MHPSHLFLARLLREIDGTFQSALTFDSGNGPNSIAVGDFNGDGKLDLVTTNYLSVVDRHGGYIIENDIRVYRVLAATHRNLRSLISAGTFREDPYYRLHVVHIDLPPLRQRREDIPLLVATFMEQLNQEHGRAVHEIALAAMDALQS